MLFSIDGALKHSRRSDAVLLSIGGALLVNIMTVIFIPIVNNR